MMAQKNERTFLAGSESGKDVWNVGGLKTSRHNSKGEINDFVRERERRLTRGSRLCRDTEATAMKLEQLIERGECNGPVNLHWQAHDFSALPSTHHEISHCLKKTGLHAGQKTLVI